MVNKHNMFILVGVYVLNAPDSTGGCCTVPDGSKYDPSGA